MIGVRARLFCGTAYKRPTAPARVKHAWAMIAEFGRDRQGDVFVTAKLALLALQKI